jgi:hypothetical protein
MTEEMDCGQVLAQDRYSPQKHDTAASMTPVLANRGAQLLEQCVNAVHRANAAGLSESDEVFHWQRQQSTLPGPPGDESTGAWSAARKTSRADAELQWDADASLASPAGLVRKCRSLDYAGIMVGGSLGTYDCGIIHDAWAIQLEPKRRGEELKLVAVDYGDDKAEPDTVPALNGGTIHQSGLLAVTGSKKKPALWVYAGCGWARIREARIAGRAKMTMPQLIRALGKRGAGPDAAMVATSVASEDADARV